MHPCNKPISKKIIENEIYKIFEQFKEEKNIKLSDFLKKFDTSIFKRKKYRKIRFTYESLIKLILFQKLKGIRFQTQLVRHLKRHPKEKFKLGFSKTPDQTTISYFINHILDDKTKKLLDFTANKIAEVSEKFGIIFDIKIFEPEKPRRETKERNQFLQKNKTTREICKIFKKRLSPFINLHLKPNTIYTKNQFINLIIHLALHQDFAENGSKTFRIERGSSPDGDTLLYHLKKYSNIAELQKMFITLFEIIWEMARRANIIDPRKPVDCAIDFTNWHFYGNRKAPMVVGMQPDRGTDRCYRFATINIVESGKRFTLLAIPVSGLDTKDKILSKLLNYATKRIKINKIYLDRGFFDSKSIATLNRHGIKWLMPGHMNYAIRRTMNVMPTPSIVKNFKMKNTTFNLVIDEKDGEKRVFATNLTFSENDTKIIDRLFQLYSKRWGIETSYRVKKHSFRPKTTSKNYKIRLFYFMFSVLLYNLWILADILIWLHLYGLVGENHILRSKYFGEMLKNIDPGG